MEIYFYLDTSELNQGSCPSIETIDLWFNEL